MLQLFMAVATTIFNLFFAYSSIHKTPLQTFSKNPISTQSQEQWKKLCMLMNWITRFYAGIFLRGQNVTGLTYCNKHCRVFQFQGFFGKHTNFTHRGICKTIQLLFNYTILCGGKKWRKKRKLWFIHFFQGCISELKKKIIMSNDLIRWFHRISGITMLLPTSSKRLHNHFCFR